MLPPYSFYKITTLLVFILSTSCPLLRSQTLVKDTFERAIQRLPNDSMRLAKALRVAKYFENIDSATTWKYYRIAKSLSEKLNNRLSKIEMLELEGVLHTKNNPGEAYIFYKEAIDLIRQTADTSLKKYEASLLNNIGVISYLNGDYEGAIQSFIEAVQIYEKYNINNGNLIPTITNIATTYEDMNFPAKATKYCIEAVNYADKNGDPKLQSISYINLAANLLNLGKLDSGLIVIHHALDLSLKTGDQYNTLLCYVNIGRYFEKSNNSDSALFYFNRSLPLAKEINSPYDVSSELTRIANIEVEKKYFDSARTRLDSAESINKKFGFRDAEKDRYKLQSAYFEKTGNLTLAITFLKKYDDLKDTLLNETSLKRIDFFEERYQSEKKQQAINELQREKKIQDLYIQQKSTLNHFLAASLAALLIVGFLGYRNFRHRHQLAKQQDELQQQRIRELEKDKQLVAVDAMLKGQEEERSRLAKDLHDGLGGLLSGVKFSLSNMKDNLIITPDNMTVFERSLDMLDTSIRELRRVAHNMMPEMLTKFGLDEALKEYCNSINTTELVNVKYQSLGMEQRLEQSTEIIIYRIVQELLNNVLKHAAASEAFVQLIRQENRLSVVVEDNGKGFDPDLAGNKDGAGLMNVRSRVDYLKGQLDIHTEPGKGTLINIEFNL